MRSKRAFTLAETLITLTILGVVAAIVVPALINRQTEAANRTKLKKAMTMYEKALSTMILENDLKTNQALIDFGAEGTCDNTRPYFKTVEDGINNCRFKTADRIWWDISDIENPLIILKDNKKEETLETLRPLAKDTTDNTIYAMVGHIDNLGILRIDDLGVETGDNNLYLTKLYNFANNVGKNKEQKCDISCTIAKYGNNGECSSPVYDDETDSCTNCKSCNYVYNCNYAHNKCSISLYDENGKMQLSSEGCPIIDMHGNLDIQQCNSYTVPPEISILNNGVIQKIYKNDCNIEGESCRSHYLTQTKTNEQGQTIWYKDACSIDGKECQNITLSRYDGITTNTLDGFNKNSFSTDGTESSRTTIEIYDSTGTDLKQQIHLYKNGDGSYDVYSDMDGSGYGGISYNYDKNGNLTGINVNQRVLYDKNGNVVYDCSTRKCDFDGDYKLIDVYGAYY